MIILKYYKNPNILCLFAKPACNSDQDSHDTSTHLKEWNVHVRCHVVRMCYRTSQFTTWPSNGISNQEKKERETPRFVGWLTKLWSRPIGSTVLLKWHNWASFVGGCSFVNAAFNCCFLGANNNHIPWKLIKFPLSKHTHTYIY